MSTVLNEFLEGFEIVASDSVPSITLDKHRRLYINTSARRLMNVKPYDRLSVAYNSESKSLAIVRPNELWYDIPEFYTSNYNIDRRYYMSARHFAKNYGYSRDGAPYTFVYDSGSSDGSVFVFSLDEEHPLTI